MKFVKQASNTKGFFLSEIENTNLINILLAYYAFQNNLEDNFSL